MIADVGADQFGTTPTALVETAVEVALADVVPFGLGVAQQAEQLGQGGLSSRAAVSACVIAPERT